MRTPVGLLSLATASPPHELLQPDVAAAARTLLAPRSPHFERLAPVFRNAGIGARQSVRPLDWFFEDHDWAQRMAAYQEGATELFVQAARGALDEAALTGSQVDVIVTVSTTGIATPTLEARAMERMGFRADASRAPLFGLGCAGGATGLGLAARLAAAQPGAVVLFVCVELCTLAFKQDEGLSNADVVAAALFGDGAAACVMQAGADGFAQVTGCAEHTWPATLDIMGWRVDPMGLGVIFAQAIPPFARRNFRPAMDSMLAAQDLRVEQVDRFLCHPGGAKVLTALEAALGIGEGALDHEREVLRRHGNMSAPTLLFVLDRARRVGLPPLSVASALGPGFTASSVTLRAA